MSGHGAEVPHEAHDPFTRIVALSVAVYAVVLAVAGLGGKNAGKDMLAAQIAASDLQIGASNEWAQYQAKTVRESESTNKLKEHRITRLNNMTPAALAEQDDIDAELKVKLTEYAADKEKLRNQAHKYEEDRKDELNCSHKAHVKDSYFDIAELMTQIAIVIASVAILAKAKWAYVASVVLVVLAVVLTFNGYALAFHLGFIEGGAH